MSVGESITLVRARGGYLTKFVHADGDITRPNVKFVDLIEQPIADLTAVERLLRQLEGRSDFAVVRGAPADPSRVTGVRKLFHADRSTGDAPTLIEVPRRWVAFDVDSIPRPAWVAASDLISCAAVASCHLPAAFRRASLIVQPTASHGLKPGLRLRLWAWLNRPVCGAELQWWMRRAPVDTAVFRAAQTIVTAAPVFLPGAIDPLPLRLAVIPGQPEVDVPAPEELRPPAAPERLRLPPAPRRARPSRGGPRSIFGLLRFVANAPIGRRNGALYWAACRVAEDPQIDPVSAAAELQAVAQAAGLASRDAAATIESALRGRCV